MDTSLFLRKRPPWGADTLLHLLQGLPDRLPKAKSTLQMSCGPGLGPQVGRRGVALPDGSDNNLQGGDHVFDKEVIPVVPVFCRGIACPGIWEGDTRIRGRPQPLGRHRDLAQSQPSMLHLWGLCSHLPIASPVVTSLSLSQHPSSMTRKPQSEAPAVQDCWLG